MQYRLLDRACDGCSCPGVTTESGVEALDDRPRLPDTFRPSGSQTCERCGLANGNMCRASPGNGLADWVPARLAARLEISPGLSMRARIFVASGSEWYVSSFDISFTDLLARTAVSSVEALNNADVAELVDALDLGSSAARRGGSSPLIRTKAGPAGAGRRCGQPGWARCSAMSGAFRGGGRQGPAGLLQRQIGVAQGPGLGAGRPCGELIGLGVEIAGLGHDA